MKFTNHLLFLVFLMLSSTIQAQRFLPVRLEVPSDIKVESFHVEELGEKGVLIFYESNEVTELNERKWFFGLFDTGLKQQWLKFIPIEDKFEYKGAVESDNKLRLLFRNMTRGRSDQGYYEIVSYDLGSDVFTKVTGTFPAKAEIAGFEAIGNVGCIALNIRQEETDLLFIDLTSGDINPVKVLQEYETYMFELHADKKRSKFYAALKMIKDNRYITDGILKFSLDGSIETTYDILVSGGLKSLSKYVILPQDNNQLKIFGTYDIITGRIGSFKDLLNDEEARSVGMYYLHFDNKTQSEIKFYDFLSFDNIYGSLGDRRMEYKKSEENEGGESQKQLAAYYYLYEPQVITWNNQYVFSVEVYKPYYTTETRMDYDYYGRPVPYSYQVFGGFDFYDVILVGLSEDGDMIWNNDFAIDELRAALLDRYSIVFTDDEYISVAYVNNGKIHLQSIEGPVDIGKVETAIETKISRDRISEDEFNHIEHWYSNYFLVYGYQKIKNRSLDDQSTRTAFYINKVAYN